MSVDWCLKLHALRAYDLEGQSREDETQKVPVSRPYDRCVIFVCTLVNGVWRPGGTGFLVSLEDPASSGRLHHYVVTARHCLENAGSSDFVLRVNVSGGSSIDLPPVSIADWFRSTEGDVALVPVELSPNWDVTPIPVSSLVDADWVFRGPLRLPGGKQLPNPEFRDGGIPVQVGDETYFMGLFAQSPGNTKNLPVARFGHIARMPLEELSLNRYSDPLDQSRFLQMSYLVECHSWGGFSGSPVVWIAGVTIATSRVPLPANIVQGLLGLTYGHYQPVDGSDIGNAGIAIVTPASYVRSLLYRDDVVARRETATSGG